MASLALDQEQRPAAERTSRGSGDLIDLRAITADLEKLAKAHTGNERDLRSLVAQKLKVALTDGRAKAERLLLKDRHGRRCAERLCRMEDEVIRILFEFARKHLYPSQNPSEAERMAVVATGGYGRGLQAPVAAAKSFGAQGLKGATQFAKANPAAALGLAGAAGLGGGYLANKAMS